MKLKIRDNLFSLMSLNNVHSLVFSENNYDKVYSNIINTIKTGKSNDINYKLFENILKKRNKELNNLYLQVNSVIKLEFLE